MPNTSTPRKLTKAQRRARRSKSYAEQFADWLGRQAEADENGEPTDDEFERLISEAPEYA